MTSQFRSDKGSKGIEGLELCVAGDHGQWIRPSCSQQPEKHKFDSIINNVVVAQLVKRLLQTPEVCGLTPVISKLYIGNLFVYCLLY